MTSSISGASGGFNAASLKQMQEQMFKAVDSNSDNKIDKAEMSTFQKSQQADGKQGGPSVDEMFSNMDSDSDGAISRLESDAALAKMSQQMQAQGPPPPPPPEDSNASSSDSSESSATVFDALDTNKDGTVSASELLAAFTNDNSSSSDSSSSASGSSATDEAKVKKIFDVMDTNKDGSVSKSELEAALAKIGKESSSTASSTDTTKSSDTSLFALAAKSYMQASFSNFAQSTATSALSSSALYA
jgi:Ca2+-binding EF-hand superfamily protein